MWRHFATLSERTSDAQLPEDGGDPATDRKALLAAAGLWANRHCAEDLPAVSPHAAMTVSPRAAASPCCPTPVV
jgi:hypothetical protein